MSTYRIISTTAFPLITQVRVYGVTIDHIREEHPEIPIELPSLIFGLQSTIVNPTRIESGNRPNTLVYISDESTNASGDPLRVPIKIIEGTSGLLKTAFFATPENPSQVVWRRS